MNTLKTNKILNSQENAAAVGGKMSEASETVFAVAENAAERNCTGGLPPSRCGFIGLEEKAKNRNRKLLPFQH